MRRNYLKILKNLNKWSFHSTEMSERENCFYKLKIIPDLT